MTTSRPTTKEERIKIVMECIAHGYNYGEIAIKYNVSCRQVYGWVQRFKELEKTGMPQSMSRVAKCIDNEPMEGFRGILKRERYYGKRFSIREDLVAMIEDYIYYYNKSV